MAVAHTSVDREARLESLTVTRKVGYILLGVVAVGFTVLALLVVGGNPTVASIDSAVQTEIIRDRTGWLDHAMWWSTQFGGRLVIGLMLLGITLWVVRNGRCLKALTILIVAFAANPVLEFVLKRVVDRPRPTLLPLVAGTGPAFPSGHVLATVGFYGLLAVIVWRSSTRRSLKALAWIVATAVIVAVAVSRIYLGVHWLTDVVAGILVGTAFVLIVDRSLRGHSLGSHPACSVH